jgi:putative aminopeptidase FrvX
MLAPDAVAFLHSILDSPGPSGFESRPAKLWRDHARAFADVRGDVAGNSIATVTPKASSGSPPTVMLAGHIDEIGLIVTYIDDDGYVYVGSIGGWDAQVLIGQRVRFIGRDGDVIGVVGKKPIHLIKHEERDKASKLTDLWIDIGSKSRAETEELLSVGDAGVLDAHTHTLLNDRVISRSIDNRIGAFVVLEALRRYAAAPGVARVVAVATTQEEIAYHGGGALVSAFGVQPHAAIVVDVTFATDHPGMEKKELGDHKLGGGPVLSRGSLVSPALFALLRDAAERGNIPFTIHAAGRDTGTDADAIHLAREGVATALVSVPNRYMHSPNEMVSLDDLDRAAELIADTCRSITATTDFTVR